jgi:methionyl-tRNA formyltransferase
VKSGPWRIIFLGTPAFALPSLKAILDAGEEVAAVVTQPDRPRGRGQQISPSPVKELATARGLPVLQPQRLKDPALLRTLADLRPELMIVVAYGRILTPESLALPAVGFLNVHASLLPAYRGAAPINWALIRGEMETGVTVQWVKYEVDTGDIFLQERVPIEEEDTAGTLAVNLAQRGAALLVKALEMLRQGQAIRLPQSEAGVSYAPPLTKEMRWINWQLPAPQVAGWIRGLDPRPGAQTRWRGREVKLFGAKVWQAGDRPRTPGAVLRLHPQGGLEIACGQGSVLVKELQLSGHRRLAAPEFLRGNPMLKQVLG